MPALESLEQLFLEAGINWTLTVGELKERRGVENFLDSYPVITLAPSGILTDTPLTFRTHYDESLDVKPLKEISAYYFEEPSARENYATLVHMLADKLGPGTDANQVTCLITSWRIGLYVVKVLAWPPELNRDLTNVLHVRDPKLARAATISIEAAVPQLPPDESLKLLERLDPAAFLPLSELPRGSDLVVAFDAHNSNIRRNPAPLVLPGNRAFPVVWHDALHKRYGISTEGFSWTIRSGDGLHLVSYAARPARGSGYASLSARVQKMGKAYVEELLSGHTRGDVYPTSVALGAFWGVPVTEEEGVDD